MSSREEHSQLEDYDDYNNIYKATRGNSKVFDNNSSQILGVIVKKNDNSFTQRNMSLPPLSGSSAIVQKTIATFEKKKGTKV